MAPISNRIANALVSAWHRHHRPLKVGMVFSIGLYADGILVGAIIVGRPVARRLAEDPRVAEVRRCVVAEGVKNGCSKLYAHAWQAWRGMGGKKLLTYTLPEEGGASLRGAGWRFEEEVSGQTWAKGSRARLPGQHPEGPKFRWSVSA